MCYNGYTTLTGVFWIRQGNVRASEACRRVAPSLKRIKAINAKNNNTSANYGYAFAA